MTEKKTQLIKSIMINLGIVLILVSATASKDLNITYFFLGLLLLAIETVEIRGVEPRRLVAAEIIVASALSLAAVIQLTTAKSFGTPQIFLILLLLGGVLISVEAVRKYADL